MKKRKGKEAQPGAEGEQSAAAGESVEAPVDTAAAAGDIPADSDHLDATETEAAAAPATDDSARPEAIVGEVGDDDITHRIELSSVGEPGETDLPEPGEELATDEPLPGVEGSKLESIVESLLFATDRPLALGEFKRLLGERDGKRITEALEGLRLRRADSGIQLVSVAGAWQLRTHPENGAWVAKLVAGRPPRLSRAMMETLSIVAYRQPITRPEIDEIRGVDCGPVLRTLLDRGLIRIIGKKEEVGRPMLYGTTPEFLKIFSLRDLTELPTLREFHELGADDRAKVDAQGFDPAQGGDLGSLAGMAEASAPSADRPRAGELPDIDPDEEDTLIEALDRATQAAGQATRSANEPEPASDGEAASAATSSEAGER